ncbi:MAG: nucleoside phosphorylase [Candidatus Aenigmarchaeota archaeon]|nr:nucleoside phosphorylase [Candidatus Aenigmarchaeota archaeon]
MNLPIGHLTQKGITTPDDTVRYIRDIRQREGVDIPDIPSTCLISYSDDLLDATKSRFSNTPVNIGIRKRTDLYFFRLPNGNRFGMVSPQYGAPMAATLLEELISMGFQRFLSFGITGHIAEDRPTMNVGDVILVEDSISYDGTTRHYLPPEQVPKADRDVTNELKRILKHRRVPFRAGRIATTDAIYRETSALIRDAIGKGALAFDMETAALFACAEFHRKPIGAMRYVSDIVLVSEPRGRWEHHDPEILSSLMKERILEPVLEFTGSQ